MQIRKVLLAAGAGFLFFGWISSAAAFSVSYDQTMVARGKNIQSKVKLKDAQFRMDSVIDGMETVTVRNGNGIYSYIPSQNMAIQLPDIGPTESATQPSDNYMDYLKQNNARLIRSETINGYGCDVYEFLDPKTNGQTTVWIWKDRNFPVKFLLNTPQGPVSSEMTNIVLNAPVDEASFSLPSGVKIMQMNQMMQGAGGMIPDASSNGNTSAAGLQQAIQQLQNQAGSATNPSEPESGTASDPGLQQLMKQLGEQLGAASQKSR